MTTDEQIAARIERLIEKWIKKADKLYEGCDEQTAIYKFARELTEAVEQVPAPKQDPSIMLAGCERRAKEAAALSSAAKAGSHRHVLKQEQVQEAAGLGADDNRLAGIDIALRGIINDTFGETRINARSALEALADYRKSLRQPDPDPAPDVEPDEETPRFAPVEFIEGAGSDWDVGHFLGLEEGSNGENLFIVVDSGNDVFAARFCRLRRENEK